MTDSITAEPGIDARVAQLEDAAAISTAKAAFINAIDTAINDGKSLPRTPPSALESLIIEVREPMSLIRTYAEWATTLERISFSLCFLGSENIEIDENETDNAVGQWVSWHPVTFDNQAWLVAGRFCDQFTRVDGEWRLTKISFTPEICNRWEEGWGASRFAVECGPLRSAPKSN